MPEVNVRFGSGLARVTGQARTAIELSDGATVRELFARLEETVPALSVGLNGVLAVVNGAHVDPDHRLSEKEEVSLLLPAAGG